MFNHNRHGVFSLSRFLNTTWNTSGNLGRKKEKKVGFLKGRIYKEILLPTGLVCFTSITIRSSTLDPFQEERVT